MTVVPQASAGALLFSLPVKECKGFPGMSWMASAVTSLRLDMFEQGWSLQAKDRTLGQGGWNEVANVKKVSDGTEVSLTAGEKGKRWVKIARTPRAVSGRAYMLGSGVQDDIKAMLTLAQAASAAAALPVQIPHFDTSPVALVATFLGGHGVDGVSAGAPVAMAMTARAVHIGPTVYAWERLRDVSVAGPGLYQTGGGWWGGGIGITGALEGAAFASLMNAVTTRTRIETVVRLIFAGAEANLYVSTHTPEQIDVQWSPLRAYLLEGAAQRPAVGAAAPGGPTSPDLQLPAFCTQCGAPRQVHDRFCGSCGNPHRPA